MKSTRNKFLITSFSMFIATIVLIVAVSFVYDKSVGEILRNGVFDVFFSLGQILLCHYSFAFKKLDYDNEMHPYRFLLVYCVGLVLSCLFPLINREGWVFLCVAVALLLFSNTLIALYSMSGFIFLSLFLLKDGDIVTYFVYFTAVMIAAVLFQDIDKSFKVVPAIAISNLVLFILETAGFIINKNEELSAEQFVMPIANIAINCIVMFFVLKYFNTYVVNRYRNKYLEINDQEYKALADLKAHSKDEYFRSIHTAYLAERMAGAIGCDVDNVKNCAYYHRIKYAYSYKQEEVVKFLEDNQFPPEASALLLEYYEHEGAPVSKEAGIVYISDKLIASLMSLFKKDKKIKVDYNELIETLIDKNMFKSNMAECDISVKDYNTIKEILLKETLYYDFLR
ncbi:MAG: hypothetical protein J5487_05010 [Lachnospiraceae bacterium]|nr:hypothetical protein [Lachnospiraceae bacterium]